MTTMSASKKLALVDGKRIPPVQVADDDHHECKLCICVLLLIQKTPQAQVTQSQDSHGQ